MMNHRRNTNDCEKSWEFVFYFVMSVGRRRQENITLLIYFIKLSVRLLRAIQLNKLVENSSFRR